MSVRRLGTAAAPDPIGRLGGRVVLALALLVGTCALSLLGGRAAGAVPGPGPAAEAATDRIAWRACGERLECARVRVPLDWSRPRGRTISLSVIRHLASRPEQRIGTLFFNPGGPGSSGVAELRNPKSAELLDRSGQGRFDVVSWDPRGTGASTRVRCFADPRSRERFWGDLTVPTTVSVSRRYQRKAVEYGRRCAAASGDLLEHISTADTVRDLDHLRRLVGDARLTYLGWSYGTVIGETYANLFPRRVRAMVLDGIVHPVSFTKSIQAAIASGLTGTDRAFAEFQRLCELAGPERCALAGKGPVAPRVRQLIRRLRRGSIPAPSADPPGRLTYSDLLLGLFPWVATPALWPDMAEALDQAAAGDGSALTTFARGLAPFAHEALVPAVALQCADKPPARVGSEAWPEVIGRFTRTSFSLGPVTGWWLWAPCSTWPVESARRYAGPWNATTTNPILVVGTRFDPRTPFADARRVARLLGNAVLLTHDGYGHTSPADPSACVVSATGAYLTALITPPRGTVCPSDRVPFDPRFGDPLP